MPFVVMAKPTDPFKFETHDVDGIKVHMNKSATAKKGGVCLLYTSDAADDLYTV